MIPVLGVPVINRPDLLARFLDSIDEPCPVLVIDNSDGPEIAAVCESRPVTRLSMPSNLGVAASWNLIVRSYPDAPWWCIANADTQLGRGDLARLATEMAKPGPAWVGMNGDWRVMGLDRACVDTVGLFDENFYPIYCEDCDYEYRCRLAGVPWYFIDGGAQHEGSAAIRSDAHYAQRNGETHASNRAYYEAKWGGSLRGGEVYTSPFNRGGSVADWHLDLSRLQANVW